uniref:Uncharacterized protein n=1 Tax=Panagrolaimus sp. PS1159 TaxID=55785 RepID=A0AC35EWZ9_9BILA
MRIAFVKIKPKRFASRKKIVTPKNRLPIIKTNEKYGHRTVKILLTSIHCPNLPKYVVNKYRISTINQQIYITRQKQSITTN